MIKFIKHIFRLLLIALSTLIAFFIVVNLIYFYSHYHDNKEPELASFENYELNFKLADSKLPLNQFHSFVNHSTSTNEKIFYVRGRHKFTGELSEMFITPDKVIGKKIFFHPMRFPADFDYVATTKNSQVTIAKSSPRN